MAYDHLEWDDAYQQLSVPDSSAFSRRAFLQAAAAGAALATLPSWADQYAQAATPLGANEGILVILYLGGGNDGLNTVVPYQNPAYAGLRKSIALDPTKVLPLGGGGGLGLHPNLVNLKTYWDQGKVAIVNGVSYPNPSLSHFDAQAIWAAGHVSGGNPGSGWVGRYIDGAGHPDDFSAVSIGSSIPLLVRGNYHIGSAFPTSLSGAFGASTSTTEKRMYTTMRAFAGGPQNSTWGDSFAKSATDAMDVSVAISPYYSGLPSGAPTSLALAAQLINANLGVRVLHTTLGNYDTHSGELATHATDMTQISDSIKAFFDRVNSTYRSRVIMMIYSEFGRRPAVNVSNGTDHGTAAPVIIIGDNVKGGMYGTYPSLTTFDRNGNLNWSVDFRAVYGTILDGWLGAPHKDVIGGTYDNLGFLAASPGVVTAAVPPSISSSPGYWLVSSVGKVSAFGGVASYGDAPAGTTISTMASRPQRDGYWLCAPNGKVFAFGGAQHYGDMSATALAGGIVAMASTTTGLGYWLVGSDGGVFAYGDAPFYGSTGGIKLAKPVVGMAATPSGKGYWFCASDGGVFAYGDAAFYGSMGTSYLAKPVVGMASSPTGLGYWLVASDGGVFAYGDATFYGSTGNINLVQPVNALTPSRTGKGYWFVARDGGVFAYGDAVFKGGLAGSGSTVVAMGA